MKHKTFFAVLVLATVMTGCLKVKNKNEVAAAKAVPMKKQETAVPQKRESTRALLLSDVYVEFIGQPEPQRYDVLFSWPETRDRIRLTVAGQVLVKADTQQITQHEFRDVQGGRNFSVLIEILDAQDHIISFETRDLEVPKDYVFSKNFRLTNDLTITNSRVFFVEALVTTQHFKLNIKTKNIITVGKAYIQNFAANEKAMPITHGRNGGDIRIEADMAEGELDITMNSEAGGDGFKAVEPMHCPPMHNGGFCMFQSNCPGGGSGWNAGANGDLYVKIINADKLRLFPQSMISEGGNVGPGSNAKTPEGYPVFMNYSQHPMLQCPKSPVAGASSPSGKICLTYAGQTAEQGCE